MSYCAGEAGIEAENSSRVDNLLSSTTSTTNQQSTSLIEDIPPDPDERREQNFSKKRVGEGDVKLDKERLAQALNEEKKRKMRGDDEDGLLGKKKKVTHAGSHDVTEEELGVFIIYVPLP